MKKYMISMTKAQEQENWDLVVTRTALGRQKGAIGLVETLLMILVLVTEV